MEPYKLGEMEQKFADLIWEKEPVSSGELTRLCEKAFRWKRTTTYTMLKRLCLRGIFSNEQGVVRAQMTKEEFWMSILRVRFQSFWRLFPTESG